MPGHATAPGRHGPSTRPKLPGVGEEFMVGQRRRKADDVGLVLRVQVDARDQVALVGVRAAVARLRAAGDVAARRRRRSPAPLPAWPCCRRACRARSPPRCAGWARGTCRGRRPCPVSSNRPWLGSGKLPVPPMLYSPVLWKGVSSMRVRGVHHLVVEVEARGSGSTRPSRRRTGACRAARRRQRARPSQVLVVAAVAEISVRWKLAMACVMLPQVGGLRPGLGKGAVANSAGAGVGGCAQHLGLVVLVDAHLHRVVAEQRHLHLRSSSAARGWPR
jgi:hypothetical protein